MVGGPMLTFAGLRTFAKMRLTENIPCSKVRSAAMGLVELQGQARPRKLLQSPISSKPCCWWQFKIQEYRRSGKHSRWVTIRESQSPEPFFLEDNTGRVLVDPLNAELLVPESTLPLDAALRTRLQTSLSGWGLSLGGWFASSNMRVLEKLIMEHSPLYVMGEFSQRVNMMEGRKERLLTLIREAKQNPQLLQQADADKDGQLDQQEWDAFRIRLEQSFLQEEQNRAASIPPEEQVIVRAGSEISMLISTSDERQLIRRWRWSSPLMIVGGMGMTAGGIWFAMSTHYPLWLSVGALALGFVLGLFLKKKGGFLWN